ncbi:hypothetical protein GWK47_027254 [Chionoecetes opilio]|uniref:Uncharacterized protein n=1 Tax=Chionoecetes opilio TaxID=41210 RepID=A0A8J8W9M4_CHIOP|nr:hypothetical protein GWK47_027254 [Chionoecetes opilio]
MPLLAIHQSNEEGHSFHSGLLSTSQRQLGFQHLKLEVVDGLGHPPGLMESSRTAEWFGWTFTTEEQVGETEKFFIVLSGMVLRHQSLLQEGQCVVLPLAGSVIGGGRTLRGPPMFSTVSLRGIHEGPSITESFEDSNVRTRGRAEAGFEEILEDHLVDMMAAGQPKQTSSEFLLNPNASTLHHASVRSRGVETEGDDLVPDARFVHLLQDHCSHVSASRIRACRDPKKELGVIFPCEEDGDAVLRIAREGREEFSVSMQDQPLRYLLVPQFHDLLGGLLSPRNSCSMDRALRDRHTPNVHSKNLSGSCER